MHNLVRGDVVYLDHMVETASQKATSLRVECKGCHGFLVVRKGTETASASDEVPYTKDRTSRGDRDGSRREHEHLLDGDRARTVRGAGPAHDHLARTRARVEEPHGRIVRAGEDEIRVGMGHLPRAHVVCVGSERVQCGLRGDVPELDGGVVRAREDLCRVWDREFTDMDGLLVFV